MPPTPQHRGWAFTLNNPKEGWDTLLLPHLEYAIFGDEVAPTTGTPHIQGYIYLKLKTRLSTLKTWLPTAHLEPAKGTPQQNFVYCSKDKDYKEIGTIPLTSAAAGKAYWEGVLASAKDHTLEATHPAEYVRHINFANQMKRENPKKLERNDYTKKSGLWIHGPPGTGKSLYARDTYPEAYLKSTNKWWDGYRYQKQVIIEDVDPDSCKHLDRYFKIWSDIYDFPAEQKGTMITIRPELIIVTSNYTIEQCFPNPVTQEALQRRFETKYTGTEPTQAHPFFNTTQVERTNAFYEKRLEDIAEETLRAIKKLKHN